MAPRFDTVHHLKAPFSRSVSGSFQSPSNISVSVSRMWADTATGYLLGIWKKTISPRQSSCKPTVMWILFLFQCSSVPQRQGLTNGNVSDRKPPRVALLVTKTAEDWGRSVQMALLLSLPVGLQASAWVSVRWAADAEPTLLEAPGHSGLSITATPVGVRKRRTEWGKRLHAQVNCTSL